MLTSLFHTGCVTQGFFALNTIRAMHCGERHCTGCNSSCFVKNNGVNATSALQHINTFNHYSHLCSTSTTHHQCSGSCKTQCARARNDENRNSSRECFSGVTVNDEPSDERANADGKDNGNKNSRHSICNFLYGSFGCLSITHQFCHASKRCFRSHSCGAH